MICKGNDKNRLCFFNANDFCFYSIYYIFAENKNKAIMENLLTMSKEGRSEYCCNIIQVGTVSPIEGSDFLGVTLINGQSVVVRKDQVKEGDIMFYASNECQLNDRFLSVNNLFDIGNYELNANKEDVGQLLANANNADSKEKSAEYMNLAKKKVGYFAKTGRVRMMKLRKVPSYGFLFTMAEMERFCPKVSSLQMEDYLNVDFDTIDGELFVKAYVPNINRCNKTKDRSSNAQKRSNKFDRMIPGEFQFHYDTKPLGKSICEISPTDVVTISVKLHGTSAIFSNIKVKQPIKLPIHKWLINKLIDFTGWFKSSRITDYEIIYDNVYSSRTVIKNQYINKNVNGGYYNSDVWSDYNELLKGKIDKGMTVYGEIVGYVTNSSTFIQKSYDYRCLVGTNKFMPYRITTETDDGKKKEWNVNKVKEWTEKLIEAYPDIKGKIQVIPILYHGTLKDLYPNLDTHTHWNEEVLESLKNDKNNLGMELFEPMCKNNVYREGIVIRIDDDPKAEAFKLKTNGFYGYEQKEVDNGNVDIEMADNYVTNCEG